MNRYEGIHEARVFATERHKGQTRKVSGKPYITHPAEVVAILRSVTTTREQIVTGWLHDLLEDHRASSEEIGSRFGPNVLRMTLDLSELDKSLPWLFRKSQAVERVHRMPYDSLFIRTGDVIANTNEMTSDYQMLGEELFNLFNAPKDDQALHKRLLVQAIEEAWPGNPLLPRLLKAHADFELIVLNRGVLTKKRST